MSDTLDDDFAKPFMQASIKLMEDQLNGKRPSESEQPAGVADLERIMGEGHRSQVTTTNSTNAPSEKVQPTPRTDAAKLLVRHENYETAQMVPADLSRQLERELAEMTAMYVKAERQADNYCIEAAMATEKLIAAQSATQASDTTKLYHELLYAVANKWPGETRHQTALRYIHQAERPSGGVASGSEREGQDG